MCTYICGALTSSVYLICSWCAGVVTFDGDFTPIIVD